MSTAPIENADPSARPHQAGPGRPRDPAIQGSVLAAARGLLVEMGYNRLSFELLAQQAGVTRPTIYRRWPSKAHLVYDAVFPQDPDQVTVDMSIDTGDLRADLHAFIARAAEVYADPVTRAALPGLLAEFHGKPELREEVIHDRWTAARTTFAERLERAKEQGQIGSAARPSHVLDLINGALLQHVLVLQEDTEDFVEFLTDFVLAALREPKGTRRSGRA